jgi:hypothetical protein
MIIFFVFILYYVNEKYESKSAPFKSKKKKNKDNEIASAQKQTLE